MASHDKKLNKEQLKAVNHGEAPLLIIAGAGTGKTTVIIERIKHLIAENLAKPSEILALTFTEKAAREMEERIDVAMPYGYTQMWVSTYHSFCDRLLRLEGLHIGIDPKYRLMSEAESVQYVRKNLFKFDLDYFRPLGNPTKFISGMLQHFSRLQDEDISPDDYVNWVESKIKNSDKNDPEIQTEITKWKELSNAFQTYCKMKEGEGLLDFGDLITKTLELIRRRPNLLKNYRKQFKYILVDEFQDTNVAQYELLKLLAPPDKNPNLTVVGDDSQSIYKFRGAAISNIIYFKEDYREAQTVILINNYRSSQTILDGAYSLIQFNNPDTLEAKLGINKNLRSVKNPKDGEEIEFFHADRVEGESENVAKKILELAKNKKYKWKDFAVLVRANNHAEPFMRAFARAGLPYQFLGPGRLFRQKEVTDLISYLKVLYNFDDSVALYKLLSMDELKIPNKDLIKITNYAKRSNISLYDSLDRLDDISISADAKEKISKIVKVIEKHLELSKSETAGQLLYYFLEELELLPVLLNPDTPEAQKKAANISKFFDKLKSYETDHKEADVFSVVDWIDLASELGESPLAADTDWTNIDAVNILTVHSAKGLEFPVVFLVNLVSQRFPTIERREQIPIPEELIKEVLPEGDFHMQEERRLFYVGMTRAEDYLFLTAADFYGEGKREKKVSPFVAEALGKRYKLTTPTPSSEQLSFIDFGKQGSSENFFQENEPLKVDYLSYSQIEAFLTCPVHYKLAYIVKIPVPPSASLSFGSTIHRTLKDFSEEAKAGKEPNEKLIFELLDRNWLRDGYLSKEHEKKFFDKAKIYLSGFIKHGFDKSNLPILTEQKFMIPMPFIKGERPLKVGGVMDRVDVTNGTIEIIDYKTGANIPTQREVDNNLQLTFYALAASTLKEEPFGKDPEDIKLSLYYFDQQEKITTKRTSKQLEEAVKEIYRIRGEIEKSDFRCSGHIFCENCEYGIFCKSQS